MTHAGPNHDHHSKGLARGPALILGAILAGFGLVLFLTAGDTPTDAFPDGTVNGETFLGFETNGWTAFFTTTAGALLLFGAAQHLLAKTFSLLVGLALGACSVIALVDGDDVLGLAAANGWTKLGWGVAAAVLLVNAVLPRVGKDKHKDHDRDADHRDAHATRPVSSPPVRNEPGTETSDRSGATTRDARPGQPHTPPSDVPGGGSTAR